MMNNKNFYLSIENLLLNPENPRHPPLGSQDEIIDYLTRNCQIFELAEHIVENGLSPFERICVERSASAGTYTVLEGNRRLCALKLLSKPELCKNKLRPKFIGLSNHCANPPQQIEVVEPEDIEAAKEWIALKHNGAHGGAGTLDWGSEEKQRYFGDKSQILTLKLIDYIRENQLLEPNVKIPITTATRYLRTGPVRENLGIVSGISDPDVQLNVTREEFHKALRAFFSDVLNKENGVFSHSGASQRLKYAEEFKKRGFGLTRLDKEYPLYESESDKTKKINTLKTNPLNTKKTPRNKPNPDIRKKIITSDFKPYLGNKKNFQRIYEELKLIDCTKLPLASAFLCRVFIEKTFIYCHEVLIGETPPKNHRNHQIGATVLQWIKENLSPAKKQLQSPSKMLTMNSDEQNALRKLSDICTVDSQSPLSFKTLGEYAHGVHYPSEAKSIIKEWDNISSILLFMLNLSFRDSSNHQQSIHLE